MDNPQPHGGEVGRASGSMFVRKDAARTIIYESVMDGAVSAGLVAAAPKQINYKEDGPRKAKDIVLAPASPDADVFASRLSAHGASDDFCSRIYSFGSSEYAEHAQKLIPPFRSGAQEQQNIPHLMVVPATSRLDGNMLPRGYSTLPKSARAAQRARTPGGSPAPLKRPPLNKIDTSQVDISSPRPKLPFRIPWDEDEDDSDTEDESDLRGETPRASTSPSPVGGAAGADVAGGRSAKARVPPLKLWYDEQRQEARRAAVRSLVANDIQRVLSSSAEVMHRLQPPGVISKRSIDYLAAPKPTRHDVVTPAGQDVLVWSQYKQAQLVSAREERQLREQSESARRRASQQALADWKDQQEGELTARMRQKEQEAREERRYRGELKKWLEKTASDKVKDYAKQREKAKTPPALHSTSTRPRNFMAR